MGDSKPALQVDKLYFRYPSAAADSLWNVDIRALTLAADEQILLTGASGRGKSTLLYLIAGLIEPAGGTVSVAGQDIFAMRGSHRDLFRGTSIGMIFQTFNLLHGFSAIENVLAALLFSTIPPKEHAARAKKLLDQVGIDSPDREVTQLSIGQQQRVAVARAMATSPALVLADEPTASLDPENAEAAMELIQSTCRSVGAALLCTSHDPSMSARFARRESLDDLTSAAAQ